MLENAPHIATQTRYATHTRGKTNPFRAWIARGDRSLCVVRTPVIARPLQRGRVSSTAKIKGRPAKNN
jgi:hypothetical protein